VSITPLVRIDGWLDFNHAPDQPAEQSEPEQLPTRNELLAALQLSAHRWVPEIFRHGKLEANGRGRLWRVADISGRAPRNQGSCVIYLDGDDAGDITSSVRQGNPAATPSQRSPTISVSGTRRSMQRRARSPSSTAGLSREGNAPPALR
jgi:hypothetical protein